MSHTAESIIRNALSSRETYNKMAHQEAEVWGKVSGNERVAAVREQDMLAGAILKVNRHKLGFPGWCKTAKQPVFLRGLSIGCGAGRAERAYIEQGICKSFHGIDISEGSIEKAKGQAEEKGFPCTYEVADINFADFGSEKFDLVIAQTSLHHLVYLEDVFDKVKQCLTPEGMFWVHDYCGESQFQHSDARLGVVNAILGSLPKELRLNRMNNQLIGPVARREPGTLISPFESIRSADIVQLLRERFSVVEEQINTSILHLICPVGARQNYVDFPSGKTIYDLLWVMDDQFVKTGVLTGTEARMILKKST